MSEKDQNPSIIARETLRQLASLKIPPTPSNYHQLYDQIAGNSSSDMNAAATSMLLAFTQEFPRHTESLTAYANRLETAAKDENWIAYKEILQDVLAVEKAGISDVAASEVEINWSDTIGALLKQIESKHGALTVTKKKEGVHRVLKKFTADPQQLHTKLQSLMNSWVTIASTSKESAEIETNVDPKHLDEIEKRSSTVDVEPMMQQSESDVPLMANIQPSHAAQLLPLLALILEHIAAMPLGDEQLTRDAKELAEKLRGIEREEGLDEFIKCFQDFCKNFETCGIENQKLQHGLLRLLNLLVDNTRKLLAEDQWVNNQYSELQQAISQPLNLQMIDQVEHRLEEITLRQINISSTLGEATSTIKQLVTSLISNIEGLTDTTGEYHDKLAGYAEQISQAEDIKELSDLVVEIMRETNQMQDKSVDYRNDFLTARAEVDLAQSRIDQLEKELKAMGEKVHEDHLTGILNRRGLDEAFEREIARATRKKSPLCYALLDIDNFKKLNDVYGHQTGDDALVYLVNAVKEATRMEDVVARYGGEEFVVMLPDTNLDDAMIIMSRIRRDLTKKFFLHENKRLLVTFSAGLAEFQPGEDQESIFKRADEALYRAKRNGKNQILTAL